MSEFWLSFVPIFVAVDAIGVLPLFMGLTDGIEPPRVRRILIQSTIVALVVALVFLAVGRAVLGLLGITVYDFMVAGGALLFVIAVRNLLGMEKSQRALDSDGLGAVPIGVPLIVGPGVLTTTILLVNQYGWVPTAASLVVNIALAGAIFASSEGIIRLIGNTGAKTVSKLAALLLAAIAVMMVRRGVVEIATGASVP